MSAAAAAAAAAGAAAPQLRFIVRSEGLLRSHCRERHACRTTLSLLSLRCRDREWEADLIHTTESQCCRHPTVNLPTGTCDKKHHALHVGIHALSTSHANTQ